MCLFRYQIEYERNHQARSDELSRQESKLNGECTDLCFHRDEPGGGGGGACTYVTATHIKPA